MARTTIDIEAGSRIEMEVVKYGTQFADLVIRNDNTKIEIESKTDKIKELLEQALESLENV